jgi:hypothetical protein
MNTNTLTTTALFSKITFATTLRRINPINTLLFFFAFALSQTVYGQCASSMETGDVTGNVNFGTSINWANPNRVEFSDDLYARTSMSVGDTSKYLEIADFDYVLPPGSVINGIVVTVERHGEADAHIVDASVMLTIGGVPVGTDHKDPSEWAEADETVSYGDVNDNWGYAFTADEVMDPTFGVLISATRAGGIGSLFANIDYIGITIFYDNPGGPCVLPISIQHFSANTSDGNTVKVDWKTSLEYNNDFFTVERSQNGVQFEEIGTVDAQNLISGASYTFTDGSPVSGKSLYRLRQTDVNGSSTHSSTVEVTFNGSANAVVFPNPATTQLNVVFNGNGIESTYELMDLKGSIVHAGTVESNESTSLTLDVSGLDRGMYLLRITQGSTSQIEKIIVH